MKVAMISKIGILCALLGLAGCSRQPPEHQLVVSRDDAVAIPLTTVNDGRVHFFTYKFENKNINFFVRTDWVGQLHAHFDACYSCFKYKLGYVWEGNQVVCIACRIGYNLDDSVWDYVGGCVPISLKSRLFRDHLLIKHSWLVKGKKLF